MSGLCRVPIICSVSLGPEGRAHTARLWTRGRTRRVWQVISVCCGLVAPLVAACGGPIRTVVAPAPLDPAISIFDFTIAPPWGLVAYRARDGATRWTYTPPSPGFITDSSPVYHAGLVFGFTWQEGDVHHVTLVALRASDGKLLWHLRVSGFPPPIAFADDYVVLVQDEGTPPQIVPHLLVVRTSDGVPAHDIPLAAGTDSIAADGASGYACTYDAELSAFRLSDGQPLWQAPVDPGRAVPGWPCTLVAAADGIVYCTVTVSPAGPRYVALVAVRESDGHTLWQKPDGGPPLVYQGRVFQPTEMGSSQGGSHSTALAAYDAADGTSLWEIPTSQASSDAIVATGDVVAIAQDLALRAVRASDGASLWQFQLPGRYVVPAGATGGVVFAFSAVDYSIHNPPPPGTDTSEHLIALSAGDGRLYWQIPIGPSSIAVGAEP